MHSIIMEVHKSIPLASGGSDSSLLLSNRESAKSMLLEQVPEMLGVPFAGPEFAALKGCSG